MDAHSLPNSAPCHDAPCGVPARDPRVHTGPFLSHSPQPPATQAAASGPAHPHSGNLPTLHCARWFASWASGFGAAAPPAGQAWHTRCPRSLRAPRGREEQGDSALTHSPTPLYSPGPSVPATTQGLPLLISSPRDKGPLHKARATGDSEFSLWSRNTGERADQVKGSHSWGQENVTMSPFQPGGRVLGSQVSGGSGRRVATSLRPAWAPQ